MSLRLDDDEIFMFDNAGDYYAYASGKKPNKKKSSSSKKKSGKQSKGTKKQGSGNTKKSSGNKKKSNNNNNDDNEVENRKKQLKDQKEQNEGKRNVERKKRQLQGQATRNRPSNVERKKRQLQGQASRSRDTRNVQRRKNQLQGQNQRNRQARDRARSTGGGVGGPSSMDDYGLTRYRQYRRNQQARSLNRTPVKMGRTGITPAPSPAGIWRTRYPQGIQPASKQLQPKRTTLGTRKAPTPAQQWRSQYPGGIQPAARPQPYRGPSDTYAPGYEPFNWGAIREHGGAPPPKFNFGPNNQQFPPGKLQPIGWQTGPANAPQYRAPTNLPVTTGAPTVKDIGKTFGAMAPRTTNPVTTGAPKGPIQQAVQNFKSRFEGANVKRGVLGLVRPNTKQNNKVLPVNRNDTITLADGTVHPIVTDAAKGYELGVQPGMQPIYGNQFVRSGEGGTMEAVAPGSRNNGVVQGSITIPQNIVGMKEGGQFGKDEGTIILKDNHGDLMAGDTCDTCQGDMNHQYKIWFEYENGGQVKGLHVGREHEHPKNDEFKGIVYKSQPKMTPGKKLEYQASYQDTKDGGVRIKVMYKNDKGNWEKMVDHVDYGDGFEGAPYRGKSGVQDGTRGDGRVGGGKPGEVLNSLSDKRLTTRTSKKQEEELNKLVRSDIYAREIGPDNSDLHDGIDDPYSFGPRGGGDEEESNFARAYYSKWDVPIRRNIINVPANIGYY